MISRRKKFNFKPIFSYAISISKGITICMRCTNWSFFLSMLCLYTKLQKFIRLDLILSQGKQFVLRMNHVIILNWNRVCWNISPISKCFQVVEFTKFGYSICTRGNKVGRTKAYLNKINIIADLFTLVFLWNLPLCTISKLFDNYTIFVTPLSSKCKIQSIETQQTI